MGFEPYALSVHHFISSVGADAGFASIIGLAVLVLLYFAQAREAASLREQAELAAERVAQLESRLAHAVAVLASPAAAAPGVQRPPGPVPAPGNQPAPAFAAAANPSPPAGVAAPPLSAATKLIPTPAPVGVAGVAAARIGTSPGHQPLAAPPAGLLPANSPITPPPGSPAPVNRIVTPRPATAAGGATATNGTGDHPVIPPPLPIAPRPPVQIRPGGGSTGRSSMLADLGGSGSSPTDLTRVLTAVAAVAIVAAVVIVLLTVTSGGTSAKTSSKASPPVSNAPAAHHHARKPAPVNNASVTVSVLNGTPVYHLANTIAGQLATSGFKQGTVANASSQTQPSTTVEYMPGDVRDAQAVAKALSLPTSAVQPVTPDTQTLCAQTTSCSAQVVVTLGSDLSNAGTSTQTTG